MFISGFLFAPTGDPDMKLIGAVYHFCKSNIARSSGQQKMEEFKQAVELYMREDHKARKRDPYFQAPDYVKEMYKLAEQFSTYSAVRLQYDFNLCDRILQSALAEADKKKAQAAQKQTLLSERNVNANVAASSNATAACASVAVDKSIDSESAI